MDYRDLPKTNRACRALIDYEYEGFTKENKQEYLDELGANFDTLIGFNTFTPKVKVIR